MVLIEAIIRPERFEEVQQYLEDLGILGMTITEVMGEGHEPGHVHSYRGTQYLVPMHRRVKLEVVVPSWRTDEVVEAIVAASRTGMAGDGRVFVIPVSESVRISTGEQGNVALL